MKDPINSEKTAKAEASTRRRSRKPGQPQDAKIEGDAADPMGDRHRHRHGQAIDTQMR